MTFHWPQLLWLLVLPLAMGVWELTRRARQAATAHPKIVRAEAAPGRLTLATHPAARAGAPRLRWRLWLGLLLCIVALARPQWGRVEEQVFDQAREILVAVDLSRSMLAPDVPPSRLERAKLLITSLLEQLEGERVGLIVFAGTAFLQSPLSADYEILREFLPELGPDFLPQGGTNFDALLQTALDGFGSGRDADRFLIVLSDGESQDDAWEARVEEMAERGVKVLSLGIGTTEGAMLPDGHGGFVKDERGAVVLSRLDHTTLQALAQRTQGVYRDASSWVDLAELIRTTVEAGRQGEFSEVSQVRHMERYQWVLGPALVLLLLSYWREFPVHPRSRQVANPLASKPPPLPPQPTAAALLAVLVAFTTPTRSPAQEGNAFAGPLNETIARLAAEPELTANHYAELAQGTLTYAERMTEAQQPPEPGTIRDALAAVDAGQRLNSDAANWTELREKLQAFQPPEEPPPEEQPQQQEQEPESSEEEQEKSEDQKSSSDPSQSEPDPSSEKSDQSEPSQQQESDSSEEPSESEEKSGEPSEPQNQPGGESAFGEMDEPEGEPSADEPGDPGEETQQVGGQSEARREPTDPALTVPLQKLDQLKQQDSPAKLYQLMQDPNARPTEKGRDW